MKLLVISDTHHNIENAVSLVNNHKPDYLIHLGDMCEDCERLQDFFPRLVIISVIGNNNYKTAYPDYPLERVFELGGKKIFMCHGHKYHVKLGIFSLVLRAKEVLKVQEDANRQASQETGNFVDIDSYCPNGLEVINILRDIDMDTISPIMAFGTLQNLVDKVKK